MRHSCFFAAISIALLGVSGCKMEDTGPTAFNPATNVDLTFSTFDLENTDKAPDNLKHTRFWDFYQGIQPAGSGDNAITRATVNEIRTHIDRFIQATPSSDGKSYEKVRNPLDLINQVIAFNEADNFKEGRRYITQRIIEGQAGTYNTRTNGALIRFTDQNAVLDEASLNDKLWIYPTLDWTYQPAGPEGTDLDDKVYRTIQYVSRSVVPEKAKAQPELISLLAGSRFDANSFKTNGYNKPEFATADYQSRNYGGIELRQEFIRDKIDTLFIKSPDKAVLDMSLHGVTLTDTSPDCLRVELDYAMSTLRVFHSNGQPAKLKDPTSQNPDATIKNLANCGNQENNEAAISWVAEGASSRQ
ncbi:hypothetical protein [Marinobacter salexigens]|uniref:hypothetical protein n=1 Tax=Marinobacter salexigens TaxID=1925763 RepID=UPI000C28C48A|nr:hypothetical protein [Marinobacter salexigens]